MNTNLLQEYNDLMTTGSNKSGLSAGRLHELMEKAFEEGNMKDFGCEAHSIKGLMAMIGLKAFSERALKLEAKANEGDMEYVQNETKDFINSYRDICNKLVGK